VVCLLTRKPRVLSYVLLFHRLGLKELKYYALLLGYDSVIWPGPQASDEEICAEIEVIEGLGEGAVGLKIPRYANLRGAVLDPQRVTDMKKLVIARKQHAGMESLVWIHTLYV
jgi:hypothetical protein